MRLPLQMKTEYIGSASWVVASCEIMEATPDPSYLQQTIANNNTKVFWDLFKTYPAVIENYYPRVLLKTIKATLKQSA